MLHQTTKFTKEILTDQVKQALKTDIHKRNTVQRNPDINPPFYHASCESLLREVLPINITGHLPEPVMRFPLSRGNHEHHVLKISPKLLILKQQFIPHPRHVGSGIAARAPGAHDGAIVAGARYAHLFVVPLVLPLVPASERREYKIHVSVERGDAKDGLHFLALEPLLLREGVLGEVRVCLRTAERCHRDHRDAGPVVLGPHLVAVFGAVADNDHIGGVDCTGVFERVGSSAWGEVAEGLECLGQSTAAGERLFTTEAENTAGPFAARGPGVRSVENKNTLCRVIHSLVDRGRSLVRGAFAAEMFVPIILPVYGMGKRFPDKYRSAKLVIRIVGLSWQWGQLLTIGVTFG